MNDPAGHAKLILDLRRAGVDDDRVVDAMESIRREMFVPEPFQGNAYDDAALPIGHHQTVSQPSVVGRMTQALDVGDRMKVLEIGTGSGYQAAILAKLCRRLYTVERHRPLLRLAEERFHRLLLHNITTWCGDGSRGWPDQAPFERIMVTAAAADIPPVLVDQLAEGGIMVVPVGHDDRDQRLVRVIKHGADIETEDMGEVRFVPFVDDVASE